MYDEEGVSVPRYIPAWVLGQKYIDGLMTTGAGVASGIIYDRRVPADPTSDPDSFDRRDYTLIIFEIVFRKNLGCREKLAEETEKYHRVLRALRRYWGRVELVCISIGHADTILHDTATEFATALAKARLSINAQRKQKGHKSYETSKTAFIHDKRIAKTLLDKSYT